jgi:hypothetical protein
MTAASAVVRMRRSAGDAARSAAALTAAIFLLSCVATAPAGAVSYVDGISDQHLYDWEAAASTLFADTWVGRLPPHIEFARYAVQWNVMSGSGSLSNFRSWYERAGQLGLTRVVAMTDYYGPNEPAASLYEAELEMLLSQFPGIGAVEAWNEPNHASSQVHFYVSPIAAARYMNAAYSVCQVHGCTAIAGDFHDAERAVGYEHEYEANLSPSDPGNWGIHPYGAVLHHSTAPVEELVDGLPNKSADRIWFTEVGAYYCRYGEVPPRGEAAQASDAEYLVNALMPSTRNLEHVFYYEYAFEGTKTIDCGSSEDTELYAPRSEGDLDQPRSAAAVIFGPAGPPWASASAASGVTWLWTQVPTYESL